MRRLIAMVVFASALSLFGCATTETAAPTPTTQPQPVTATGGSKPLIKCSTCGVEFTTLQELQEHMKAHPEHKIVPVE